MIRKIIGKEDKTYLTRIATRIVAGRILMKKTTNIANEESNEHGKMNDNDFGK